MVAGIPARRQPVFELCRRQSFPQVEHFVPRPLPEVILVLKRSPRGDECFDPDVRPETSLQVESIWLRQQRDFKSFGGGLQERGGNDEVAQSPQFHDQQFGFHARTTYVSAGRRGTRGLRGMVGWGMGCGSTCWGRLAT